MRFPSPAPLVLFAAVTAFSACERKEPPGATLTPSVAVAAASSSARSTPAPVAPVASEQPLVVGAAMPSAMPADGGTGDAVDAVDAAAIDWKNEMAPVHTSAALEASGRALLDAIANDDADKARGFFFPREPFTPLKDAKDPDRYWLHLFRAYAQDIHKLHRRHPGWEGAVFESVEPGTPPAWVPPGDEANKIGYHRSWGTKLRYRLDGKLYTVRIHTIISWQGQWYITHLLPWKK